jgi:hypothetical protein
MTFVPVASDVLKNSDDADKTTNSTSYVKVKEVKVNEAFDGVMRIKFDLRSSTSATSCAQIRKNGVAVGTEQCQAGSSWATFTEDLTLSLVADDLLQLYVKAGTATIAHVQNFQFYYSNQVTLLNGETLESTLLVAKAAISTTNQDP